MPRLTNVQVYTCDGPNSFRHPDFEPPRIEVPGGVPAGWVTVDGVVSDTLTFCGLTCAADYMVNADPKGDATAMGMTVGDPVVGHGASA